MTDFSSIISTVRSRRVQEVEIPGKKGAPLLGECFNNAFALAEELDSQGFDPYIVTGGLDFQSEPAPNSARKAFELGQHHFWVYVDGMHLDISGEWLEPSREGTPVIDTTPPSHYVEYKRSRFNSSKTSAEDYL